MLNLLKSDLYRLIHGKALWVMTVVLVACMAFAAGMLHWVTQPDFLAFYAQAEMMTVDEVQSELVPREEAEENFAVTVQGLASACAPMGSVRCPLLTTSRMCPPRCGSSTVLPGCSVRGS